MTPHYEYRYTLFIMHKLKKEHEYYKNNEITVNKKIE